VPQSHESRRDIRRSRVRQRRSEFLERHLLKLSPASQRAAVFFFLAFLRAPFFPECFLVLPAFA
jgi:hypothetical protein